MRLKYIGMGWVHLIVHAARSLEDEQFGLADERLAVDELPVDPVPI
jgi:hypothetical protein